MFITYESVLGTFKDKKKYDVKIMNDHEVLVPTKEYEAYKKAVTIEYNLSKASIPNYIINYNIEKDYIGTSSKAEIDKLRYYLENFDEKFSDKVLYLFGKRGTQKTTLSYWLGKELISNGISVKYITMKELIDNLVNTQFKEEAEESIARLVNTQVLIIDRAFDAEQVTIYKSGYQLSYLDSFLRKRIENDMKATIFVSNNPVDDISKQKFNVDLEDLIRRSVLPYNLTLEFKDHYTLKDSFEVKDLWED